MTGCAAEGICPSESLPVTQILSVVLNTWQSTCLHQCQPLWADRGALNTILSVITTKPDLTCATPWLGQMHVQVTQIMHDACNTCAGDNIMVSC